MTKLAIAIGVSLSVVFLGLYLTVDYRTEKATKQAKLLGCEYLGATKEMPTVGFFECGSDIILKRVE